MSAEIVEELAGVGLEGKVRAVLGEEPVRTCVEAAFCIESVTCDVD